MREAIKCVCGELYFPKQGSCDEGRDDCLVHYDKKSLICPKCGLQGNPMNIMFVGEKGDV